MNLFEQQGRLTQLFMHTPVAAAYASASSVERRALGSVTDVDIGLLLMSTVASDQFLQYRLFFLGELIRLLESERIDVSIINGIPLPSQYRVVAKGQILFNRDERQRVDFETRLLMDYLDYQRFADVQQRALAAIDLGVVVADRERLQELLAAVESSAREAVELWKQGPEACSTSYLAVERLVQRAVDGAFELGLRAIVSVGLRRPEHYHDVFGVLASAGVIERVVAYRLERVSDLRDDLIRGRDVAPDLIPCMDDVIDFCHALQAAVSE
jgi:uncharacterized protein YutE (UPF0331/DUF86 family)/predicted nucleotidyltransferase